MRTGYRVIGSLIPVFLIVLVATSKLWRSWGCWTSSTRTGLDVTLTFGELALVLDLVQVLSLHWMRADSRCIFRFSFETRFMSCRPRLYYTTTCTSLLDAEKWLPVVASERWLKKWLSERRKSYCTAVRWRYLSYGVCTVLALSAGYFEYNVQYAVQESTSREPRVQKWWE